MLLALVAWWRLERKLSALHAQERLIWAVETLRYRSLAEPGLPQWDAVLRATADRYGLDLLVATADGAIRQATAPAESWPQYRVWLEHALKTGTAYPPAEVVRTLVQPAVAVPIRAEGNQLLVVFFRARPTDRVAVTIYEAGVWALLAVLVLAGGGWWLAGLLHPLAMMARACRTIPETAQPFHQAVYDLSETRAIAEAIERLQAGQTAGIRVLQEQADLLWGVLHNMLEGVLLVGRDERIQLANEASGRLLGFSPATASGKPLVEVVRHRALLELVRRVATTRRPEQAEFSGLAAERHLSARAAFLTGKQVEGVMVVVHDVTELQRLENLRKEFVANVSHELKTPLAVISAYAETLRLGAIEDPDYRLRCVGQIEEQASRLHRMILDLLQLARIEAGREVFEFADVVLGQIVGSCVNEFAEVARAKNIHLEQNSNGPDVLVHADPRCLRTIMNNLLDNAVKYTPAGGRIHVAWYREAGYGVVEVRDTGIGISVRDQARVFERFYRADRARSRESGGSGLGLAIVKHLTHAMGGDVSVESREGHGSTFLVRLPLATARLPGAPAQPG